MPETAVHHVTRPFEIPSLWPGEEFALLLVVRAPDIAPDEQLALSRQIVNAGCRYAVCTGVGSSTGTTHSTTRSWKQISPADGTDLRRS